MKDQLISYETAKLAKEKGFSINTEANYWIKYSDKDIPNRQFLALTYFDLEERTRLENDKFENVYHVLFVPTQALLARWLREKYDFHIAVDRYWFSGKYMLRVLAPDKKGHYSNRARMTPYTDTYEESFETGLQIALKLIKDAEI